MIEAIAIMLVMARTGMGNQLTEVVRHYRWYAMACDGGRTLLD